MFRQRKNQLILLLLAVLLLAGCTGSSQALLSVTTTSSEAITKSMGDFTSRFGEAQSAEAQIAIWLEKEAYEKAFATMEMKSYVNFSRDPNAEAVVAVYQEMNDSGLALIEAGVPFYAQVVASPYLLELTNYFGEKTLKDVADYVADYTPEQLVIQAALEDANIQYEQLMGDFSFVNDQGDDITWDDIVDQINSFNSNKAAEGERNLVGYYRAMNEEGAALYLEMVKLRNRSAREQGDADYFQTYYKDYEAYYGYSYEDTLAFRQEIKTHLVPIYRALVAELYGKQDVYFLGEQPFERDFQVLSKVEAKQETKDILAALAAISPETKAAIDQLTENNMLDIEPSPTKINGAFTGYFYTEGLPYIYSSGSNYTYVAHEFGHAFHSLNSPMPELILQENRDMTVFEVHSNGMQIIGGRQLAGLYGDKYSELALDEQVYDLFTQMLSTALSEEFQVAVYQRDDQTIDELNRLYADLAGEYGLQTNYGPGQPQGVNYEWVQNGHLFESPFYSLQYAMSSAVALELWQIAETDWPRAYDTYLRYVACDQSLSFPAMLREAGLADIFAPGAMENLAQVLKIHWLDEDAWLDDAA